MFYLGLLKFIYDIQFVFNPHCIAIMLFAACSGHLQMTGSHNQGGYKKQELLLP